jgi:hypothetical protein
MEHGYVTIVTSSHKPTMGEQEMAMWRTWKNSPLGGQDRAYNE